MTDNHAEFCKELRRSVEICRDAGLAYRQTQEAVDLIESQAARIQQQALNYEFLLAQHTASLERIDELELKAKRSISLQAQCDEHLARIADLEADRDCWRDQCSQRVADWDEVRKERDALKADAERWREFAEHQTWCADCADSVSTCPIGIKLQEAALQAEKETR